MLFVERQPFWLGVSRLTAWPLLAAGAALTIAYTRRATRRIAAEDAPPVEGAGAEGAAAEGRSGA